MTNRAVADFGQLRAAQAAGLAGVCELRQLLGGV
jgi:hypothetical protein